MLAWLMPCVMFGTCQTYPERKRAICRAYAVREAYSWLTLHMPNAKDMLGKLTLLYNRTRQASITTELIEIISGASALEE